MKITLELVRDRWRACYDKDRLARLYDRPMTPLEVLTRKDGEWADVPDKDRLWTVLRKGCMTDRELRLVACFAADYALQKERAKGREPDPRSVKAVEVARRFANGAATVEELDAAREEAWAVWFDLVTVNTAAATVASYAAYVAARAANYSTYAEAYADREAADAAIAQFSIDLLKKN